MESNHAPPPATLLQQCAGLSYQPALELVGRQGVEPCTSFLSGKRSTAEPAAHIFLSTAGRSGKRSPPATLCLAMRAGTAEPAAHIFLSTAGRSGKRSPPATLCLAMRAGTAEQAAHILSYDTQIFNCRDRLHLELPILPHLPQVQ